MCVCVCNVGSGQGGVREAQGSDGWDGGWSGGAGVSLSTAGGSRPLCASKAPLGLRPPPSPCEYTLYVGISIAFDVLVLSLFLCFDLPRYVTGLGCIPSPPLSGLEKVGRFHMGKLAGALEASKPAEPETEQAMNELTQRTPPTLTRAPVGSGVGGQADTGGSGVEPTPLLETQLPSFPLSKAKGILQTRSAKHTFRTDFGRPCDFR